MSTAIADPGSGVIEKGLGVKQASRPGFLSNLTAVLGGNLSCAIVSLLVQTCFARLLGPAGRGQISLCLMVTAFGVLVGGLGGDYALTFWTAESREKSKVWLPAITLTAVIGSCLSTSLWLLVYWKWSPSFLKGMTPLMAVVVLFSIPLSIVFTYLMATLTGLERFR